jgi:hypothetical protein
MVTKFTEMLPQERGAIVVNAKANKFPDGSQEQLDLLRMRNDGLDVAEEIEQMPQNGQFPPQGLLNSRRQRLSSQERADQVAQEMLKAGKTPQEIGHVVAGILGFNQ